LIDLHQKFIQLNASIFTLDSQDISFILYRISRLTNRLGSLITLLKKRNSELHSLKGQVINQQQKHQAELEKVQMKLALQIEENKALKRSIDTIETASMKTIYKLEQELEKVRKENERFCGEIAQRNEQNMKLEKEIERLKSEISCITNENFEDEGSLLSLRGKLQNLKANSENGTSKRIEKYPFVEKENKKPKIDEKVPELKSHHSFYIIFAGLNSSQKSRLIKIAESFGLACNKSSNDFSPRITHLVCPLGYQSLRVLAAAVSCKWIVHTEWLLDSEREGRLLEYDRYSQRHKVSPLQGQFFYITPQFELALNNKSLPGPKMAVDKPGFLNLLCELGKARLTLEGEGIPLILDNTSEDSPPNGMTWKDLVDLIMNL
jgi:predicted  nucleic acid-binding Zn-ribbon protein